MTEVSLEFISQQLERVLTEQGSQRDEIRVLSAIVMRIDGTTQRHEATTLSLMEELRAIHDQINRMNDRIRRLENAR